MKDERRGIATTETFKRAFSTEEDFSLFLCREYGYTVQSQTNDFLAPPTMRVGGQDYALPDLLCERRDEKFYAEIMDYNTPTFRRLPPGPRLEHGKDLRLISAYSQIQEATGIEVRVFVIETNTVLTPGDPKEQFPEFGQPCVLWLPVNRILAIGDVRKNMKPGKQEPAIYWARNEMNWFSTWQWEPKEGITCPEDERRR